MSDRRYEAGFNQGITREPRRKSKVLLVSGWIKEEAIPGRDGLCCVAGRFKLGPLDFRKG